MKRNLAVLLCLTLALILCAFSLPSDEEIKAVREIAFEGDLLTVTLGTNQSSGYEWDFSISGDCIEQTTGKTFTITGTSGDATGELSFVFKGTAEGDAVIIFGTPVGWDGTGHGDSYAILVSVGADGTILSAAEGANKVYSPTYAMMLKSGDYQYSYPLVYEDKAYHGIIAAKNGMVSRSAVADDGSYSARTVTINGNAWQVDDLTGNVYDLGAEGAETLPDFSTLAFAGGTALDTGYIAEIYQFTYEGQPSKMAFVLSPEGDLVMMQFSLGEQTSQMEIHEIKSPSDNALFDTPK